MHLFTSICISACMNINWVGPRVSLCYIHIHLLFHLFTTIFCNSYEHKQVDVNNNVGSLTVRIFE